MGDRVASSACRLAWLIGGMALLTAGCADTRGPGAPSGGPASVARAPGDGVGHYKVGRPYMIKGKWYTPYVDYEYQETGLASWYGPGFHGRMTANGEIFDENDVTAAHTTLPLPSVVRVTNLDNGRAMIVRVNDRGPFVDGRILDVSRRTAQMLGFERDGLARVHVELLADDSKREMMIAKGELPREPGTTATMLAQAAPAPAPAATPAPAPVAVAAAEPEAPARMTPVTAAPLEPPPAAAVAALPEPPPPPARVAAAAPVPAPIPMPVPAPARPESVAAPPLATPSRMAAAPVPSPRFALVTPAAAATAPPAMRPSVPPPPVAAPMAPAPAAGILVNTGTFSSAAAAERVRKRLASFGQARVVAERAGVWRVRVGPLPSPAHAERVMEAAMTIAQEEARVAAR